MDCQIKKYVNQVICGGMLLLSVLAVFKSIFVGFDIDEGYAAAQAYRLLEGDRLFADMWEPHQMSGYAAAVCMIPFLFFTGGNTTGIIIYLRVVGCLVHALIGFAVFKTAQKRFGTTIGLLISLAHLNFLPKWIVMPEFEIMQYWASCVIFLALLAWEDRPRKRYLLAAGTAFFSMLFTYPTMILLYPVYIIAVVWIKKDTWKERFKAAAWFTLPSLVMGIAFLLYLFSYMSVDEFLKYVAYIFMDESHSVSLMQRISGYGTELLTLWEIIISQMPVLIGLTIIVTVLQVLGEKKGLFVKEKRVSALVLTLLMLLVGIFIKEHIAGSLLADKNQFYLYFRFLIIVMLGTAGVLFDHRNRKYCLLGVVPGIMGVIASALITNMTLEIANARIYIGVMASCFVAAELLQRKYKENQILKMLAYINIVFFIGGLLICKLVMVRVTGCIPVTIKMHMAKVTEGPAAGLIVGEDLAKQYNENISIIRQYGDNDDKLLYFGCEHIYYMVSEAEIATPSVQGTAVFNEMYLDYYKEHPEKLPNMVIVDKDFEKNPYYRYAAENEFILDWITEQYEGKKVLETDRLIIYKGEAD